MPTDAAHVTIFLHTTSPNLPYLWSKWLVLAGNLQQCHGVIDGPFTALIVFPSMASSLFQLKFLSMTVLSQVCQLSLCGSVQLQHVAVIWDFGSYL